jgi:hypothetical protein
VSSIPPVDFTLSVTVVVVEGLPLVVPVTLGNEVKEGGVIAALTPVGLSGPPPLLPFKLSGPKVVLGGEGVVTGAYVGGVTGVETAGCTGALDFP